MYLYLFIVVDQDRVGVGGGVLLGWRPGSRCLTLGSHFCGRGVGALAGFLAIRHIKTRVQQTFFRVHVHVELPGPAPGPVQTGTSTSPNYYTR